MLLREGEIDHIETVGDLRAALADVPDSMDICDWAGDGICLTIRQTTDQNTKFIEVK